MAGRMPSRARPGASRRGRPARAGLPRRLARVDDEEPEPEVARVDVAVGAEVRAPRLAALEEAVLVARQALVRVGQGAVGGCSAHRTRPGGPAAYPIVNS